MLSARFFQFFRHLTPKTLRNIIRDAAQHRLPGLAAEMAYNTMLGLFPGVLAVLTAIGLFEPLTVTFARLAERVSEVAPGQVMGLIENFADALSNSRNGGLFSLSFLFSLWASSGALSAAMTALDQIHRIPQQRARPFWKARIVALLLTVGAIVLLMAALSLVFISDLAVQNVAQKTGTFAIELLRLWRLLALPLVLTILSLTFAFIYRFGPSQWTPGLPILPGAILAAVFWAVFSNLFRLYVDHFGNYNQVYGAIGAVIVLMLWLYISCLMLLLGDQLNVTVGNAIRQTQAYSPATDPKPLPSK